MPKSPRPPKLAKQQTKTRADFESGGPPQAPADWRVGIAERLSPAILIREPLGAMRERALARLSYEVAWDLVRTVADSSEAAPLIDTAAPSLRTLKPAGSLSVEESERLLYVGRLYVILECAYGATLARGMLVTPLARLGRRSAIEHSDSVAALEYARARLVPFVQLQFDDVGEDAVE